jgi:prefoldin beta subunit
MNKDVQEQVNNLSMLEQNAQQMAAQRQNFQTQMLEVESAIEEISNSKEAYKIIGNIMVKTEPAKLKEELEAKKGLLNARLKSMEKQEEILKEKSKKLQEEILSKIDSKNINLEESVDSSAAKEKKEPAKAKHANPKKSAETNQHDD